MSGETTVGEAPDCGTLRPHPRHYVETDWIHYWCEGVEGDPTVADVLTIAMRRRTGRPWGEGVALEMLGIPPSTPLSRLHVLQDGEMVVQRKAVVSGDLVFSGGVVVVRGGPDVGKVRWVVVRSAS